jgi:hypothetical protein
MHTGWQQGKAAAFAFLLKSWRMQAGSAPVASLAKHFQLSRTFVGLLFDQPAGRLEVLSPAPAATSGAHEDMPA